MYKSPRKFGSFTEQDYILVSPAVDVTAAFARMMTPCIYVVDLARNNFLYVSDCLLKHFHCTRDKVMPLGQRMFEKYISNASDIPLLRKFDHAFNAAFRQGKHPDWVDEVMSVDVNMTLGRNVVLIHQKAKVFATDCDGRPWLVLVLVSRSAMRDGGHIIIGNAKSHKRYHFVDDKKKGHWEALPDDRLSDTEMEMLSLSSRGYSVEEIAAMMYRSVDTVKYYRKNVFARLGVSSVSHALAVADDLCLI